MDRDKLKLIVKNLKLLVDSLESEIYSDVDAYKYEDICLLYTSPSPRDLSTSRMPSSA